MSAIPWLPSAFTRGLFPALIVVVLVSGASPAAQGQPVILRQSSVPVQRPWGASLGVLLLRADLDHRKIEDRLSAFQEDNSIPAQWPLGFTFAVRHRDDMLEVEWNVGFGSRMDFMDDDHMFEVTGTELFLWYRRQIGTPRPYGITALPGFGAGYAWLGADVGIRGQSQDEAAQWTTVLSASGWQYSAGLLLVMNFDAREDGSFQAGFDYRYRLGRVLSAGTRNDGEVFFPGGSEIDYTGHYFGVVLRLQV